MGIYFISSHGYCICIESEKVLFESDDIIVDIQKSFQKIDFVEKIIEFACIPGSDFFFTVADRCKIYVIAYQGNGCFESIGIILQMEIYITKIT